MKREEFISELRLRLGRLPKDELEDALDYYNELFLDGGEENEEKTAASLGSVDQVARQIYVDNGIDPDGRPQFMMEEYIDPKENSSEQQEGPLPINQPLRNANAAPQLGANWAKILLAIVLFPIWFPIFIVCLVFTCLGLFLGFILLAVIGIVGCAAIISGVLNITYFPPFGLCCIGGGLMLLGIFGFLFPRFGRGSLRGIRNGVNKIINRAHSVFFGGAQYENR